jgi:hypothetical protein
MVTLCPLAKRAGIVAAKLQLVSGTFGPGRAQYDAGVFRLPGRVSIGVERVKVLEINGTILQSAWGKRLGSGVSVAVAGAQIGVVAGLFTGGIALVGPYALTAAAIGAGVGLLGGGNISKALIQVVFDDGQGFVGISESALPQQIRSDLAVARKAASRVVLPPPSPKLLAEPKAPSGPGLISRVTAGAQRASQAAIGSSKEAAKGAAEGVSTAAQETAKRASSAFVATREKVFGRKGQRDVEE